jgi:murein DD-endopeptidase MepM/ murein hydrolase activator NlpD
VPLRPTGKHRRPRDRSASTPVYAASVALAAAAAGALHVPEAMGDDSVLPAPDNRPPTGIDSDLLRAQVAEQRQASAARELAAQRAAAAEAARKAAEARAERKRQAIAAARKARAERAARAAERERLEQERLERERNRWVLPTSNYRLTAGYGESGSRWSSTHTGQDFAAPIGTTVVAAAAGTVISAGYEGAYGNKIVVKHADGTETWYAHLSSITVGSGEVTAGQPIGEVGSTGNSTGPHLHFEVRPGGGGPVAPLGWLRDKGAY